MEPSAETYEIQLEVRPEDIDELDHVNNVVYLKWVQEAATAHWFAAAAPADQERLLWVVTRHEIDYNRAARLGDGIIVRTSVGNAAPRAFERHTEILRKADGKQLARALTIWCPIDAATFRPVDVGEEVRSRFSLGPLPADGG